jgi:CheY-like chemotaxis protein
MSGSPVDNNNEPEFVQQVRNALTHLYDHAHLQRHPLAKQLVIPQAVPTRTRAQELRRVLLDAIEALNPGDNVPIRSVERRPHAILFGLYVEGRAWQGVAASLNIGGRQLRRDRAAALQALASILRDRYPAAPATGAVSNEEELLLSESERFAQDRERLDLNDLVDELLPLLEDMARERGVQLLPNVGINLPKPSVNRTLIRQILISLASRALMSLPLLQLCFEARQWEAAIGIALSLTYRAGHGEVEGRVNALELAPIETLVIALGGRLLTESQHHDSEKIWVLLPLEKRSVVLVVDDNQELFELFQRYTVGHPYRLIHAASAKQALSLVRSARPDIITLDLMMPNQDGWELLHTLKSEPATAHIPVIVCSVLVEPELALSLGARMFLKKPVEQVDLLQAFRRVATLA